MIPSSDGQLQPLKKQVQGVARIHRVGFAVIPCARTISAILPVREAAVSDIIHRSVTPIQKRSFDRASTSSIGTQSTYQSLVMRLGAIRMPRARS